MKNYTQMKFGKYTFMHNPKTLVVKNKLRGNSSVIPYHGEIYSPVAVENTTITGEGIITGEQCCQKLLSLIESLKSGDKNLLSISPFPSFYAVLTELEYTLTPKENTAEIKFTFTSASSISKSGSDFKEKTYTTDGSDSLWDISYKYDIPVEQLLDLNPFVKRPDILENGWVIRLW